MSGFDDICDRSAPGKLVPDDAVWDAVREVAGGKVAHVDYVHRLPETHPLLLDAVVRECDPAKAEWIPPKVAQVPQKAFTRLGNTVGLALPDGRLLDDVLAENEDLTGRACVFKQALRAVAEGTVTREMMQYNVIKAEELAAVGWECDPCTDGWHPNGWVLDMSTMRYRPPVDAELLTIACERANLAERAAALEVEIARWRNAMRSGCMTPAEADKHFLNPAGHLIWWPDAAPVPYFSGLPGLE